MTKRPTSTLVTPPERVEVLLATCNGAGYLAALLDSLLQQNFQDFHLVVSDDRSTDSTVAILRTYETRFCNPVQIICQTVQSGSAKANFARLLVMSTGDYVFFCDQDDVWHPDKIDRFLLKARQKTRELGPDVPMFLYSDATIIGADGKPTHESYWKFKKTNPERCVTLPHLLVCAPMLGCASVMNRALVRLAANVPVNEVTGHDWWAILVAAATGTVDFLPEKTVDYRIHGQNSSAPTQISYRLTLRRLLNVCRWRAEAKEVRRKMDLRLKQAAPLLDQLGSRLSADQRAVVARFLQTKDQSRIHRKLTILRYGYTYPDFLRNSMVALFY